MALLFVGLAVYIDCWTRYKSENERVSVAQHIMHIFVAFVVLYPVWDER